MAAKGQPRRPNWHRVRGARERVEQLLEESGALLETHVSQICQSFALDNNHKRGTRVIAQSITYGKDKDEVPLRQIDQCVELYKEFILDERTGVQLIFQIPIEAKYRKDVEVIGIEFPPNSYRPRFPMVGFVRGSQLSRHLESVVSLGGIPLLQPVFLEIQDGATPRKVHGENLVQNTAAALYDFVRFDLHADKQPGELASEEEIIHVMHLLDRFERFLKEKRYIWWAVIRDWMRENLTEALVSEFNRRASSGRVYHSLTAHVPVLFTNGEIWKYKRPEFQPCDALLTRVRVPGWPGALRIDLIRYTAEAPLLVTNSAGLHHVLHGSLDWFSAIERAFKATDPKVRSRWPIEAAFFMAAANKAVREHPETELRSDLDVFDWL